jgi:hypothetical protein
MASRKSDIATLAALVLWPAAGWAQGEITGVSANPSTTFGNQPVTVTVEGTGTCSQVVVRCQAPAAPEHVRTNIALPFTVTCSYSAAGKKTITAAPEKPPPTPRSPDPLYCPGDRITQVEVEQARLPAARRGEQPKPGQPGVGSLKIPAATPLVGPPQISAVWNGGKVTPGGLVLVSGKWFGEQPGTVQIQGQFGTKNLQIQQWTPIYALGRMPDFCGFPDHEAQLAVVIPGGHKSNDHPVSFRAKHELRQLAFSDVQLVQCGDDGNTDSCNGVLLPDSSYSLVDIEAKAFSPKPPVAVAGWHSNCWGCVGNDSGTDKYKITLKNGWQLAAAVFEVHASSSDDSAQLSPTAIPWGATSWTWDWSWVVTPNDYIHYQVAVGIDGPCGIPHK